MQIESDINLAIRLSQGRTVGGQKMTASLLHKPEAVQQLVRNEQAYKFLKNVRGSPAYWQNEFTMSWQCFAGWVSQPGFSPCLQQIYIGQKSCKLLPNNVGGNCHEMTFWKCQQLKGANVYAKIHLWVLICFHIGFSHSSQSISSVVHSHLVTSQIMLLKIEFQMCGLPHAHCLLWV